ncbi:hypothetical protein TNCV_2266071 [Trichonephila clavipes]|nr:hypothetical protein TNCV_2266071 [Trichonephila clavipes]
MVHGDGGRHRPIHGRQSSHVASLHVIRNSQFLGEYNQKKNFDCGNYSNRDLIKAKSRTGRAPPFDEAHFWLNGYVNKQNCRISSEANPQVYVETPLHPEKLTVWCALWAGGILLQKR